MTRDDTSTDGSASNERARNRAVSRDDAGGRRLRRQTRRREAEEDRDTSESISLTRSTGSDSLGGTQRSPASSPAGRRLQRTPNDSDRSGQSVRSETSDQPVRSETSDQPVRSDTSDQQRRGDGSSGGSRQILIGSPDSRHEREAEKVARRVTADTYVPGGVTASAGNESTAGGLAGSGSTGSRSAGSTDGSPGTARVQRAVASDSGTGQPAPDSVHEVLDSPGSRLESGVLRRMESKLGESFGDVRVHTGSRAAASARDVNARAYTVGSDVVFDRGEYRPGTPGGDSVIAHELAHVAQQSGRLRRQTNETQYTEQIARGYAAQFVREEYDALWYAVNEVAREELDVSKSGTSTAGGSVWFAKSSRKQARKLAEQRARSDVDKVFQRGQEATRQGRRKHQSAAVDDLVRAKQQKLQRKARERAEQEAVKSVDAELAAMADETTSELLTTDTVTERFARVFGSELARKAPKKGGTAAASQKAVRDAYSKARTKVRTDLRSAVKQNVPDQATQDRRVQERVGRDQVAQQAITATEDSAADAFESIGRRIDENVDRGESTSISLNITIRPDPEVPVSVNLSGSVSAAREKDSDDLTVNAAVKFGVSADIKIATAGFNLRKLVRAGGSDTSHTMAALSYALYRHYTGLGTETLANLLWGAGQDGPESYQLKAQRWAAATESVLQEDTNAYGMVGYGGDVHASAGDDVGIASLSGGGKASFDSYEMYSKEIVEAQLGSYAGQVVTDSNQRRKLEKDRSRTRTVQETNVSVWFNSKLGSGSASATLALNAGYTYNTGDKRSTNENMEGAHTFTVGGTITAPAMSTISNVAQSVGTKIVEAAKAVRERLRKRDPSAANSQRLFDFRAENLGQLVEATASGTASQQTAAQAGSSFDRVANENLSQKADPFLDSSAPEPADPGQVLSGSGSAGFGIALSHEIPTGTASGSREGTTEFKIYRTKKSSYGFDVGVVKASLDVSRSKLIAAWERPSGGSWERTYSVFSR